MESKGTENLLDKVRAAIGKRRMLKPGDSVLAGVSGGPDSAALLWTLVALRQELRLTLRAAYVDHGLRPAAARREAALVRAMGRLWGVPVSTLKRPVRKEGGGSLEEAARSVRHEALAREARERRCGVVALGHTQDDQAETVLMWLLRGAGMSGLAGIPPVRLLSRDRGKKIRLVRPLLDCSRAEIEALLKQRKVRTLKDRSNDSTRFFRNRIRGELIPLLERSYNPQARLHLSRLASILREEVEWSESKARDRFRQAARAGNGRVRLDRRLLRTDPVPLRKGVLKLAVERLQGSRRGFNAGHWERLDRLLADGETAAVDLPHCLRAEVPGGRGPMSERARWLLLRRSGTLRASWRPPR